MNLADTTVESGIPVELYLIVQGGQAWYFTDGSYDIVKDSITYTPENIQRSEIGQDGDLFKSGLTLTFERTSVFATQFFKFAAEVPTLITIFRGQAYTTTPITFDTYWKGRVVSSRGNGSSVNLDCESIYTTTRRPGLRMRVEKLCRHILYDEMCKINREAYKITANVQTVSTDGLTLTFDDLSGASDGTFTAGMVRHGETDTRLIADQTGVVVRLTRPFNYLIGNTDVVLYPGCDKLTNTCHVKFNNLLNHGGFPYIPTSNPFRISGLF